MLEVSNTLKDLLYETDVSLPRNNTSSSCSQVTLTDQMMEPVHTAVFILFTFPIHNCRVFRLSVLIFVGSVIEVSHIVPGFATDATFLGLRIVPQSSFKSGHFYFISCVSPVCHVSFSCRPKKKNHYTPHVSLQNSLRHISDWHFVRDDKFLIYLYHVRVPFGFFTNTQN